MNGLDERGSSVTIGGTEYPLVLTTRATREISKRYGGIENLGERLMESENFEEALSELMWLITLLANQAIQIHNFQNRDATPKPLLSEDMVELMTSPADMVGFKDAITEAMRRGTKRNVESEDDEKNVRSA